VNYLQEIPFAIPEVILVSLLYLFLDIYPSVKSFRAMLTTASFIVLWASFSALTGIAYFFLTTTSLSNVQGLVGPTGAKPTIILLAALMGSTILQSLSLKISDVKIINLQTLLDGYRGSVLADITRKNSEDEKLFAYRLSDKLAEKFKGRESDLFGEYSQLLLLTGQTAASAAQIISATENEVSALRISRVKHIAAKIVRLDPLRAKQLLNSAQ
jgi:hypothetical protein